MVCISKNGFESKRMVWICICKVDFESEKDGLNLKRCF